MNLVFDFGAVLFRWAPQQFLQRLLPARAPDEAAAQRLAADFFEGFDGDWAEFDRGVLAVPELTQRIARRTGLAPAEVGLVIEAVPGELQPLPDSVALLRRLRGRGERTFFLSNMPAPYARRLEAAHPFIGGFEGGVFSSRVGLIKPQPEIYAFAARQFGIEPARLVLIDDQQRNVDAARQAGWRAVRFESAAQLEAAL